jgi:hypothetical protein
LYKKTGSFVSASTSLWGWPWTIWKLRPTRLGIGMEKSNPKEGVTQEAAIKHTEKRIRFKIWASFFFCFHHECIHAGTAHDSYKQAI